MNPELAKQIMGAWSRGSHIAPGTMEDVLGSLARGRFNRFVEVCLRRRGALEGRRSD